MELKLNKGWNLSIGKYTKVNIDLPNSVYKALFDADLIENPYWKDNEIQLLSLTSDDCIFEKVFKVDDELFNKKNIYINFYGIDTIAEVFLNNNLIGKACNMHRIWKWDIKSLLKRYNNVLKVKIKSPLKYIKQKQDEYPLWGVASTCEGFPHIRKAHYMFGWDWGPKLPDMGIWKTVKIFAYDTAKYEEIEIRQKHENNEVVLSLRTKIKANINNQIIKQKINIISPLGEKQQTESNFEAENLTEEIKINNPAIWWTNGYGKQPLYTVVFEIYQENKLIDTVKKRIGLRTLNVSTINDNWGREFAFVVNGVKIFAMGANYIPQDNILGNVSYKKTRQLLSECVESNFNSIRVWGGGHYATDEFMDICDELGLLVWHDFPFACCTYLLDQNNLKNLKEEFCDNIIRLRHHASLMLFCGNNEMEIALRNWGIPENKRITEDYIELFERILPNIVKKYSPDTFYWSSSPSAVGGFLDTDNPNKGDSHFWSVWLGGEPIKEYKEHYFRFCSEFGFESFPTMKTIKLFASSEDFNPFSKIMEHHQKCYNGNSKILTYLLEHYKYPYSFEEIIYVSQLMQADAIQCAVEHMRRNRGRCMGTLYWQLNDCWPAISWSSIDYSGNWKALQYRAKEFYADILLSINVESDILKLNVSNEKLGVFSGKVVIGLYKNNFDLLYRFEQEIEVGALDTKTVFEKETGVILSKVEDKSKVFLAYQLFDKKGLCLRKASYIFVEPKHYNFLYPNLQMKIDDNVVYVKSDCYIKSLYLETDTNIRFKSNYQDILDNNWTDFAYYNDEKTEITNESIKVYMLNKLGQYRKDERDG